MKEDRYSEALNAAKKWYRNTAMPDNVKDIFRRIFPELEKSEDERVRQELIEAVQGLWNNDALPTPLTTRRKDEWLAWLKKQGEQKPVKPIEDFKDEDCGIDGLNRAIDILEKTLGSVEGYQTDDGISEHKSAITAVRDLAKEKKEQKPAAFSEKNHAWSEDDERNLQGIIDEIEANKNEAPDYDLATYDRFLSWLKSFRPQNTEKPQGKSALEAINEKPVDNANKVVPKFHKGEWITNGYLHCQISDVLDDRYIVNTKFAKRSAILFKPKNAWHLWTIEDAKDGDVLAIGNEIFIYAHRKQTSSVAVAHCFVDSAGGFYLDGEFEYRERGETILPATKEQRDTLWSKMKEAGYEWDSEKKELKEITATKPEVGDGEEDDEEADDKAENWKLTLARQQLKYGAHIWKTPKK